MKKFFILSAALVALTTGCTESQKRELKSASSEWNGGLNRTLTVYDYSGNPIKAWTGKFDVQYTDKNSAFFDLNGKRVIVSGGIMINEEN